MNYLNYDKCLCRTGEQVNKKIGDKEVERESREIKNGERGKST